METSAFITVVSAMQDLPDAILDRLLASAEEFGPEKRQQIVAALQEMEKRENEILTGAVSALKTDFKNAKHRENVRTESASRADEISHLPSFNS